MKSRKVRAHFINNKRILLSTDVYDLFIKRESNSRGLPNLIPRFAYDTYSLTVQCFGWGRSKEGDDFWRCRLYDLYMNKTPLKPLLFTDSHQPNIVVQKFIDILNNHE